MVHTQIVCAVAVDGQRLGFPKGVRAPPRDYQALANRCMDPNPAARPTFGGVTETMRRMADAHPTLQAVMEGGGAPAQWAPAPPPGPRTGGPVHGGPARRRAPARRRQRIGPWTCFASAPISMGMCSGAAVPHCADLRGRGEMRWAHTAACAWDVVFRSRGASYGEIWGITHGSLQDWIDIRRWHVCYLWLSRRPGP